MKKVFCFFSFLVAGLTFTGILYALPSAELAQFEKANIAYREGKFDEAAALYQTLADKHSDNPAFFYNLGNSLYREGKLGTAILAYERARLHDPRNADIRYNLNYVRGLLEYRVEDKRNEFIKIGESLLGYFTFQEIALIAFLTSFVFFASWAFALFFKADASWGFLRKTLLFFALGGLTLFVLKNVQRSFFDEAIVTFPNSQVYYGPSVTDQQAFRLGEGLKAYVVDSREGWKRILIASGESGWIQQDQIQEIRKKS